MTKPVDNVNHPPHYRAHPSGVECIDIVEHMNFCLGNVVKYVWRADLKGAQMEDLKKARFYLNREISRLRRQQKKAETNTPAPQKGSTSPSVKSTSKSTSKRSKSDTIMKKSKPDTKAPSSRQHYVYGSSSEELLLAQKRKLYESVSNPVEVKALGLAALAHAGQTRKDGVTPYFVHLEKVVYYLREESPWIRAVGWLHDVLEDTDVTAKELHTMGIPADVIESVQLLTRPPDTSNNEYLRRIRNCGVARLVKAADIRANLEGDPTPATRTKYLEALEYLRAVPPAIAENEVL